MNFSKNQNIFLSNALGNNLWSPADFERQMLKYPANHPWLLGSGWLALSMDAAGSANLGMLKQAVIPRFPAHGHPPEPTAQHSISCPSSWRLSVQRKSCAGLEGAPGPLTRGENKIWSNLHRWESTGRWILGLPHRREAALGAGAGEGKAEFSVKLCIFCFFTIKRIYNKTSAPLITNFISL